MMELSLYCEPLFFDKSNHNKILMENKNHVSASLMRIYSIRFLIYFLNFSYWKVSWMRWEKINLNLMIIAIN